MKIRTTLILAVILVIVCTALLTATPFVANRFFVTHAAAGIPTPTPSPSCTPSASIVEENAETTGVAAASEWNVGGAGDPSIQGFASDISVNKGGQVVFKIKTNATNYKLDIYRMGYYGGNGARKWATVQVSLQQAQTQPACNTDSGTGLVDCGNWSQSAVWNVPATAVSGIYFAKVVRNDTSGASHIFFIVRDDACGSDLLFQTSDTTWQAYNDWGDNNNGKSFYGEAGLSEYTDGQRAFKISYNRPFNTNKEQTKHSFIFNAEYPMVRWLEANGYDVSYTTGVDSARQGQKIQDGHKVFLSVGHDEYWSGEQRGYVEAARNAGVNLAFFSGNEIYWKTRWENSYRTLVCYKETHRDATNSDPHATEWTGTWRDPRFSPPADGGRPENALIGAIFKAVRFSNNAIEVADQYRSLRFWRNIDWGPNPGPVTTLSAGTLSFEYGGDQDNGHRPAGLLRLSSTTKSDPLVVTDWGTEEGIIDGTATHHMTLYRHPDNNALVFGASTVQWSWGLDNHLRPYTESAGATDDRIKQATVNLFADMGVQPGSLQSPLTAATQSTDTTRPTSTITSPSSLANVEALSSVTITGTAADTGGEVAGVEVSVDDGVTWHPATGLSPWSYAWKPATIGGATIKSRAVDDSGNIQNTNTAVLVNVVAPSSCSCGGCSNDAASTKSLSLNGTSTYVRVPNSTSINITGPLTVEAWIKTSSSSTEQGIVERHGVLDEDFDDGGYALRLRANGKLAFYTLRDPDYFYDVVEGSTTISANTWHHVAGVFDGGQLRVYLDGVLDGVKASTFAPITGTKDLLIGAVSPNATNKFNGSIDEVRLTAGAVYATNFVPSLRLTATGNTKGLWRFESLPGTQIVDASCSGNHGTLNGGVGLATDVADPSGLGLKGYWKFDEGSGTTTADSSGTGNTGTLNSATWTSAGKLSNALSFSGVAQDVNMGTSTSLKATEALTISAWIYPTGSGSEVNYGGTIVNREGEYQVVRFPDGTIQWAFANTTPGWNYTNTGAVAPLNQWTHIALVYNNWAVQTYANGVLVHTRAAAGLIGDVHTSDNELRVGGRQNWNHYFNGKIDEVRLYNRGLSAGDVTNLAKLPPVGYWKFDESSGTSAADSSGSSFTGTLTNNATFTAGKINNAVTFDGTDDYVQVGAQSGLVMTDALTIAAWIYPTGPGSHTTDGGTIVNKEGEYELVRFPDGTIRWALYNTDPGWNWTNSGGVAPLNRWTHVVLTYANGTARTYIDGVLVHTRVGSGLIGDADASENDFRIGGRQATSWPQFFQGKIDEVRVYHRPLTAAEVTSLASEPVGYWKFDENAGTSTADSSGNSFNGTLTNGATWTTGKISDALTFDGTNDHVQVGAQSGLVMTDALTITAWIFPTGPGSHVTDGGTIVNKEGEYQLVRFPDGGIRWALYNTDPGWAWTNSGGIAPLNQWTHVALVYGNGVGQTYINGVLVHTRTATGTIGDASSSENDFRIGGRQANWIQYFQGKIDEVRIYRIALQDFEIAALAQ